MRLSSGVRTSLGLGYGGARGFQFAATLTADDFVLKKAELGL